MYQKNLHNFISYNPQQTQTTHKEALRKNQQRFILLESFSTNYK